MMKEIGKAKTGAKKEAKTMTAPDEFLEAKDRLLRPFQASSSESTWDIMAGLSGSRIKVPLWLNETIMNEIGEVKADANEEAKSMSARNWFCGFKDPSLRPFQASSSESTWDIMTGLSGSRIKVPLWLNVSR
jgi:hypothetical protein